MEAKLAVTIPTRSRPDKLIECLQALEQAQSYIKFPVYVCDSSPDPIVRGKVAEVCAHFPFAALYTHEGKNIAASKNFCAKIAKEPLLVNVDDDVNVEPQAIWELYQQYTQTSGWTVVCGSVFWGVTWDGPFVIRRIGYGRPPRQGENPSFLLGAFFLYPKALVDFLPWNERVPASEDVFMGALWRSYKVALVYEPKARAVHNRDAPLYGVDYIDGHIYTNLFDALIANRNLLRAAMYEIFGFAAGVNVYSTSMSALKTFVIGWYRGHRYLARDWKYLTALVGKPLPPVQTNTALNPESVNLFVATRKVD